MKIAVIKETREFEERVSCTPEIVKKFINIGFKVSVQSDAGISSSYYDNDYKNSGAEIVKSEKSLLSNADLIFAIVRPNIKLLKLFKKGSILVCQMETYINSNELKDIAKLGITCFALEQVPRISRAQSMDVLSSQSNLAGYRAVIEASQIYRKAFPMMMTAAGTIPPARVLVMGAGVAGLQAIATAKRMGAIVFATDVRMASKEQVESLGGKFLTVEGSENLETEGGYAKEASEDFKKKQEDLLAETLKKINIVVCTALIPGKKAPIIIKDIMIEKMQPGSIIYDLAAVQGGNTSFTEVDKVINRNGVKIMGDTNILNKLPSSASNLYAKNLFNFVLNLFNKEEKKIKINLEDEIIEKTLVK